ncbi:sirohydrochlorin nickelochelatase [Methanofollis aquaemaris]|uniref:Sirohydrochlorin nickelochelatase n=1 Tax=Methanofollis aquaemaris TaxID=126734 RepID=A0A8A3S3H4_9EURY|nr:sirohydrochlorin nickelochelatase [Methanofollis aquaemaris]QSZ66698.1 sirohydrochlorin nickelochelatase [Methanofollis aquaemaris]
MSQKGLLLVGHGSKLSYNQELIEKTAAHIADQHPEYLVRPGFMSMNTPTVEDALNLFKEDEIEMLVVVPLFLAKGIHIVKDIPALLGLPEGENKGTFAHNNGEIPLVYAGPIGPDPLLADLMVKNAEDAINANV